MAVATLETVWDPATHDAHQRAAIEGLRGIGVHGGVSEVHTVLGVGGVENEAFGISNQLSVVDVSIFRTEHALQQPTWPGRS